MSDETPEIKVKLDQPHGDPKTPSSLKNARESLGHHIRNELFRESLHALTDDDKLSNMFAPTTENSSTNSQGNTPRGEGQSAFGGPPSNSTLRPQQIREVSPEKISGEDIVAAISKMNISLTSGLNNISQGINTLTLTTSLVSQNIDKVSSLLGTVNVSLDKQKNVLDDISDTLAKSRYDQPQSKSQAFDGSSGLGRSNIGPTISKEKSKEEEKTEHDLIHNVGEAGKDIIKYASGYLLAEGTLAAAGGIIAKGILGGLAVGLPAIMTGLILGTAKTTLENTAKEKDATGHPNAGRFARVLSAGNERASQMAPIGMVGGGVVGGGLPGAIAGGILFGGVGEIEGMGEGIYNEITRPSPKIPKHEGRNKLGHHHHEKGLWDKIKRELLVGSAEGAELQPHEERHEGRNKLGHREKTDKPVQVAAPSVAVDSKGTESHVSIEGQNVYFNINGKSFMDHLSEFGNRLIAAQTGQYKTEAGIEKPKSFTEGIGKVAGSFGEGFKKLKEKYEEEKEHFKEGMEKAEHDMTPEGRAETRKRFMAGPLQDKIDELNGKKPQTDSGFGVGSGEDLNKLPGLYTGPELTAPSGIGSIGNHFGIGGIAMPQTPAGLGVSGIGKGVEGAGPAIQQRGASGGPIRQQGRGGGGSSGSGGTRHASGNLAKNQNEAYNAAVEEGLSPEAAKALVANMSGEALKTPNIVNKDYNSRGQFAHMARGIVQWDPTRSEAIKKQFGKYPNEMSVAEQTKAALWEMKTNPKYKEAWAALKEGKDPLKMVDALVRHYEHPANSEKAINERMGYYHGLSSNIGKGETAKGETPHKNKAASKGEDPRKMKPLPGESAEQLASRIKQMAPHMENGECVALAKTAVGAHGSVRDWRRGENAVEGKLPIGTPVATFMDRQGKPSELYDAGIGTGKRGAGTTHAGVVSGYTYDKQGNITGLKIQNQWAGSKPHESTIPLGGKGEHGAQNYYSINDSSGKPLGEKGLNPMWKRGDNVKNDIHASINLEEGKTWWGSHKNQVAQAGTEVTGPKGQKWQVAQQKPTPKQQEEEQKPTQVAKDSQATPFISPPITSYQVPHKDPHGTGNRIEFASSSPPLKPDSPEQTRKFDLAASEMVNKWLQNHQGSTGRSNLQGTTGVAGSPSIYEKGMGATPGAFSTEGNPHLHRTAGSEYRHGSTDMRANPNLEIPAIYPRRGPAEGSADFHHAGVPLMARGTSPGQQAHDLTPHTRRDPEISKSRPTHNQALHEMSAGRAAAHERAQKQRPSPASHAGTMSHHTPEASSGKHSASPYGDIGHFDSGLRDRFLSQYLDGHG